jgi:tryptophanyl-tRNA synthetase
MADNLSSDQRQFFEAACEIADRFNETRSMKKPS